MYSQGLPVVSHLLHTLSRIAHCPSENKSWKCFYCMYSQLPSVACCSHFYTQKLVCHLLPRKARCFTRAQRTLRDNGLLRMGYILERDGTVISWAAAVARPPMGYQRNAKLPLQIWWIIWFGSQCWMTPPPCMNSLWNQLVWLGRRWCGNLCSPQHIARRVGFHSWTAQLPLRPLFVMVSLYDPFL